MKIEILVDEYKLLKIRSEKMVFSYGTALYLHGMSDRVPHIMDVTIPQGYNVSRIKKDYPDVRFHYIKPECWDVGLSKILTPMGAEVILYDKERCICDLINNKKNMDMQIYTQAVMGYFKKSTDVLKVLKYGKIFRIKEKIRTYIEVLS